MPPSGSASGVATLNAMVLGLKKIILMPLKIAWQGAKKKALRLGSAFRQMTDSRW